MQYNCQSEIGTIKRLLLKHPRDAFRSQEVINGQWKQLNYSSPPDFQKASDEYEAFVSLLKKTVPEIHFLPSSDSTGLDSIYTHDPVLITRAGAILCSMGKEQRFGEPAAAGEFLRKQGIPIFGEITGDGKLEGGDIVWLDEKTLVVGHGYRSNAEGIRQLRELTEDLIDEFVVLPLPHWNGPGDVLHTMSNISPVDKDLAVVYSRLLTVQFRNYILDRGMKLIEVPDTEYESMGCNVLAVAPRQCIMLAGNPVTRSRLEAEGVMVWEYRGDHISGKGAGGPTCLTRPIFRVG